MADIADKAGDLMEMTEELALRSLRSQKSKAVFTGYCLNCEDEVEKPKRWCDADCRDQWEKRNK